jgi:hypothetical protein
VLLKAGYRNKFSGDVNSSLFIGASLRLLETHKTRRITRNAKSTNGTIAFALEEESSYSPFVSRSFLL